MSDTSRPGPGYGRVASAVLAGSVTAVSLLIILSKFFGRGEVNPSLGFAAVHFGFFVLLLGALPAGIVAIVVLRFTRVRLVKTGIAKRRGLILVGTTGVGALLGAAPFMLLFQSLFEAWIFMLIGAAAGLVAGGVIAAADWTSGGNHS